jgi:hypothetical protein
MLGFRSLANGDPIMHDPCRLAPSDFRTPYILRSERRAADRSPGVEFLCCPDRQDQNLRPSVSQISKFSELSMAVSMRSGNEGNRVETNGDECAPNAH